MHIRFLTNSTKRFCANKVFFCTSNKSSILTSRQYFGSAVAVIVAIGVQVAHSQPFEETSKMSENKKEKNRSFFARVFGSLFTSCAPEKKVAISGEGPCPIVFAGPSGAGKGTIIKALMDKYPNSFGFSVSHTTRGPRPGEENGVHYYFVEKSDMESAIANNEFIEYANVHTNIYGTSIRAVEQVRSKGKVCILDIDIQGVKLVKKSGLACKYIFITPPSVTELESRLRGRGTETEDKIQIRLKNAIAEMEFGHAQGNFDAIVMNEKVDVAVEEIVELLKQWFGEIPVAYSPSNEK